MRPPVIDKRHEFAWLFSHYEWLMIAVTAMMLVAEAYGFDTSGSRTSKPIDV